MKNRKIVFVNPALSLGARYGRLSRAGPVEAPLGLCYLAAAVRQSGFEPTIIDAQATRLDNAAIVRLIDDRRPALVAITSTTLSIDSAEDLARRTKALDGRIKTIIGGSHFSAVPEQTMRECAHFDAGVIGEGEETLREMLGAFESGAPPGPVRGAVWRDGERILFGEARPRIRDLDSLPMPAFDLLPDIRRHYRVSPQNLRGRHSLSLVTSRGCPGSCAFCDRSVFGNRVTMHGAQYMFEMVAELNRKHGIDSLLFEDDTFALDPGRLEAFSRLLATSEVRVRWSALCRVDQVTRELLETAREGGCWQISYGVESGSQRILDLYHKNITIEKVRTAVALAKAAGLKVKCLFMWGNPGEDAHTLRETERLALGVKADDITVSFFTPYPGSAISDLISAYGAVRGTRREMSTYQVVFCPRGLTVDFLVKSRKRMLMRFYLRPRIVISYLSRISSLSQIKEYLSALFSLLDYHFGTDDRC